MIRERARQSQYHAYSNWYLQRTWGWKNWYRSEAHKALPRFTAEYQADDTTPNKQQLMTALVLGGDQLLTLQEFLSSKLLTSQGQKLLTLYFKQVSAQPEQVSLSSELDLTAHLFKHYKVSVDINQWLMLADICYWQGSFILGYSFRKHAENIAHEIVIRNGMGKAEVLIALKWALEVNDVQRVNIALEALPTKSHADKLMKQQLEAFSLLMSGQPEAFQTGEGIFKGLKVQIQGPAPYSPTETKSKDMTDWLINFNHQPNHPKSKTARYHASLYNAHDWRRLGVLGTKEKLMQHLDVCFLRRPVKEVQSGLYGDKLRLCEPSGQYLVQKSLNAAPAALVESIFQGAKQVAMSGVDFFISDKVHQKSYREKPDAESAKSYMDKIRPMIINHDLFSQRRLCKHFQEAGYLLPNYQTTEALNLSDQEYAAVLSENSKGVNQ